MLLTPAYWYSCNCSVHLLVESIVLGIINFCFLAPVFLRLLFSWNEFLQQGCIADNPGCLHVFDHTVISLIRTLPEPNNCNHIHTRVPLINKDDDEDVAVVRGYLPSCRMNSLTVHGNMVEVPHSIELSSKKTADGKATREYEVLLIPDGSKYKPSAEDLASGTLVLHCKSDWTHAMLVMRNYLIEPGSIIYTPEVSWKKSGQILRPPERLVAGAAAVDLLAWTHRYGTKLKYFLLYHGVIWAWNTYTLSQYLPTESTSTTTISIADHFFINALSTIGGLLITYLLRCLVFAMGKYRMNQIMLPEPNVVRVVDLQKASQRSQPSQKHQYYLIRCYLPTADHELQITAKIDETKQLYWSLIFYDEYGVPLPQCVFDRTVTEKNRVGTSYDIDVRLRNCSVTNQRWPEYQEGVTYLDIGPYQRRGYCLIRLLHPVDEQVKEFSKPTVELLCHAKKKKKKE